MMPHPAEARRIGPIDRVDFLTVRLPFVAPFGTSVHTWSVKEALLLRVESGGAVGWGECVADPDPFYSAETTTSAAHILRAFLLPCLEPGIALGEALHRMGPVRGNRMAKATLENALLDLLARQAGLPLHTLLGFPAKRILSGISICIHESIPALLDAVEVAARRGYHRVKMKIMKGKDVAWVAAVRQRFPDLPLMADANGDYRLEDADHLAELDGFGLMMIEQPLSYTDIAQHAHLQRRLATSLCLDESIHDLDDALTAIELGACRIINIKQGRVGGLLESLRIASACLDRGIGVWSGGMDETGIGRACNIHLQTADGFNLPGDTSETARYFHEDLVEPAVTLDPEGFIAVPPGPGIGVMVLEDRVEKYTLGRERVV
jgi:o-succinylbenzoate synthase